MIPNQGIMLHLDDAVLGGCKLVRRISAGGMGEIYLAEQLRLGNRIVAVKVVHPDDDFDAPAVAAIEQRFRRETRILGRLSHPNILPVHDGGVDRGFLYLVMEYAPAGSLADAIRGHSPHPLRLPLEPSAALDMLRQIGAALQYSHDHGVIHRDVKPANVLVRIEDDGHLHLLLADFGVAHELDETGQTNHVMGTVAYMAPEQFQGISLPATDQYALGIVAYQLLTGRTPFQGSLGLVMHAHLFDAPQPIETLNPAIPHDVEAVITRALAKDPAERYPSVEAFVDALAAALAGAEHLIAHGGAAVSAGDVVAVGAGVVRRGLRGRKHAGARSVEGHAAAGAVDDAVFQAPTQPADAAIAPAPARSAADTTKPPWRGLLLGLSALLILIATVAGVRFKAPELAGGAQLPRALATRTPFQTHAGSATLTPGPASPTATKPPSTSGPSLIDALQATADPGTATVQPGQRYTVVVHLTNTGTTTWSSGAGYALTCDIANHPDAACAHMSPLSFGDDSVPPGSSYTFTLYRSAPDAPGTYHSWLTVAGPNGAVASGEARVAVVVRRASTPAPQPSQTPTTAPTPTATPSPTETPSPTDTPTPTDTPQPSPTDTPQPTATDVPSTPPTPPDGTTAAPTSASSAIPVV